jgi:outer membrane protein assembly factor BamE (lipoprotein component of BamABCDE complex)
MQEMKHYKLREIALYMSLAVMSVLIFGCVATESNVQYSGVENSQLQRIERGTTTKDQLIAIVGEPTEESITEDGTEFLRYTCTEKKDNKFAMFPPPIAIEDKKETEHTVVFKLRDGIVQRYWKER